MRLSTAWLSKLLVDSGLRSVGTPAALAALSRGEVIGRPSHYYSWASEQARGERPLDENCLRVLLTSPRALRGAENSPWVPVRRAALEALCTRPEPTLTALLADVILTDPSREIRGLAVGALQSQGSAGLAPVLGALKHSTEWQRHGVLALMGLLPEIDPRCAVSQGESAMLLTDILASDLPAQPARIARARKRTGRFVAAGQLAVITLLAIAFGKGDFVLLGLAILVSFFAVLVNAIIVAGSRADDRRDRERFCRPAADALTAMSDKTPLVRLIQLGLGSARQNGHVEARRVLVRLLPLVAPEDAPALRQGGAAMLVGCLNAREPDLALAGLHAIEQAGGGCYLPHVTRMLAWDHAPELRDAARRILPVLEERARSERAADTLVRPGQAPPDAVDTLLRPGTGHVDHRPEELLRVEIGD